MAELDLNVATTSTSTITDYSVDSEALDYANNKETFWDFSDATRDMGYYKNIPEFYANTNVFATWVTGKGFEPEGEDMELKAILDHITGWGQDNFQSIMWNMFVIKKVCGDSFAEIMTKGDVVINIKPISPERMRIVCGFNGRIKRYEITQADGSRKKKKPEQILHFCNNRIGDEIHGISIVNSLKWTIDAYNEGFEDERMIRHRDRAMGILYVDSEDEAKILRASQQYEKAVKNGTMLILSKDTAKIEPISVNKSDRLAYLTKLENRFYSVNGVPRILTTSEGSTEASSKVGYLTFEPLYTREQKEIEDDLWNQMGWKIKFNRPPSLGGTVQEDEQKNTGQVAMQPNDVAATMTPE